MGNPDLLILDEPTAGLDPKQRVIIRRLIEQLSENKIIIISTHIVSDIETIAKEILMMRSGEILTHGTVSQLTEQVTDAETDFGKSLYAVLRRRQMKIFYANAKK